MNRLTSLLWGSARIRITSADPERCINRIAETGILFRCEPKRSEFEVTVVVPYGKRAAVQQAVRRSQSEAEVIAEQKGVRGIADWFRRPVLMVGVTIALLAVLILPRYVWVVTVSGNENISDEEIIRAAEDLGVRFGTPNALLDSQVFKNQLLERMESLQWAAVNCSGGVCDIQVRERDPEPNVSDPHLVTDVVAGKNGTLSEIRVLKGTALCSPGETVLEGDLLVTGILAPSVHLRTAHAQAEIYALTVYERTAVMPLRYTVRNAAVASHEIHFLQLGRIRINLSGNSRICTASCDKMINRKSMTLPGGYTLPVTWITETCFHFGTEYAELPVSEAERILTAFLTEQISSDMTDGTILSSRMTVQASEEAAAVSGLFACREMIAREREVNLFGSEQPYGRTNSERRTN